MEPKRQQPAKRPSLDGVAPPEADQPVASAEPVVGETPKTAEAVNVRRFKLKRVLIFAVILIVAMIAWLVVSSLLHPAA